MCDTVQTWSLLRRNILHVKQTCEAPRRGRNRDVSGTVLRLRNPINMEN